VKIDDGRQDLVPFPLVQLAQGGRSPDGRALLVEAATKGGGLLRFAILLSDLQRYVSFLLVSASKVVEPLETEDVRAPPEVTTDVPIPVASIAVGESSGNDAQLEITVGPAELTFAVPLQQCDRLARTILTMSAQPDPKYKM